MQKYPDMLKLRESDFEVKFSKFNENLRTQTLKEMTLEGGRRNLKDYIFKYLEDPENYIKIQPEFLESLLDLLIFLIKRGFLVVQEIAEIKFAIFSFLKYFMSSNTKGKFQGLAELLIDSNQEKKVIQKIDTQRSEDLNRQDSKIKDIPMKKITGKNLKFVSKMLTALKYIESTIYDLRFEYLAHEDESHHFFDATDLNKNMDQEELNRILKDKLNAREDYMVQLSKEVASPVTHYTFTLLDIMTMTDLEVSK